MVEGDGSSVLGDKVSFTVLNDTPVVRAPNWGCAPPCDDGASPATFADLQTGAEVVVWVDPEAPVAESYPPQVTAEAIAVIG